MRRVSEIARPSGTNPHRERLSSAVIRRVEEKLGALEARIVVHRHGEQCLVHQVP
jgi:hypothetical protein